MSDPPPFTLVNDCPLEGVMVVVVAVGGGGGWQTQQLSDKLKDLIMKHPREKQTYTQNNPRMTYSKVVNVYGSSYAYGSKAGVINQN